MHMIHTTEVNDELILVSWTIFLWPDHLAICICCIMKLHCNVDNVFGKAE